jgi:hypothetical protein
MELKAAKILIETYCTLAHISLSKLEGRGIFSWLCPSYAFQAELQPGFYNVGHCSKTLVVLPQTPAELKREEQLTKRSSSEVETTLEQPMLLLSFAGQDIYNVQNRG